MHRSPHSDLSLKVQMSLRRDVHGAPEQSAGDEAVVDRYDEERHDVEDEEGGGGVDLRVQPPGVGVRGAGHEGLVAVAGGEGVQVGEDGLRNGQSHREGPDGPCSHTGTDRGTGLWDVQRFDDSFVPERSLERR